MPEWQDLGFLLILNKLALPLFMSGLFCFENPSHSECGFLPR